MLPKAQLVTLACDVARREGLDPSLVCAIVEQESGWNTYAVRSESESGFATRYGPAYQKLVAQSATKADDRWIKFEDLFYTSYGLMQVMYPVALEMVPEIGQKLSFPTELCDPETGLTVGCRLFRKKLATAVMNVTKALLYWNGGGNPNYPAEVLARVPGYKNA